MRTVYHEFESLEHLLATRLLPGGDRPIRVVVFGGTGAVGGATVIDLCELILASTRFRTPPLRGEIWATGSTEKEIASFASRLYLTLEQRAPIEKVEPRRHYRIDGRIDLHFSVLTLQVPQDLPEQVRARLTEGTPSPDSVEAALGEIFARWDRPFLRFVEGLGADLLHAVVVAIPLPSVATYTLDAIDRIAAEHGLDHRTLQRLKSAYLQTMVRGLATIQQQHARHVVMAHTTAVGGMYRVDGGKAEIRLGFAHSALGKLLVDKKYFADELTQLYVDHGFDVLVTAAAIGIDAVDQHCHLPLDRRARARLHARAAGMEAPPIPLADLDDGLVRLYPRRPIPFDLELEAEAPPAPLAFGPGKELLVDDAIRSGENGLFSVANCVALYHVMKVAIPEELAKVLVRHAVFGPERRNDWFKDKIAYYTETESSFFALRLLETHPRLERSHLGAFAVQAYQALGSSTHQARLHELGLLVLLLRLLDLGRRFRELDEAALVAALQDVDGFLWHHTRAAAFEDLDGLDVETLARHLGELVEMRTNEEAGRFLGYDIKLQGVRQPGRERFLLRIANRVRRAVKTVTSLGTPIVYRRPVSGEDRILVGPWVAPLELAVADRGDVHRAWRAQAEQVGAPFEALRDWVIVNNGFVDLRPHALATSSREPGPHLVHDVARLSTPAELLAWIDGLAPGGYFTTCGLVALKLRLERLGKAIRGRQLRLGTHDTWKHLFVEDAEGRHLLSPGLVETARMYSEGLGKVTGTESLWPGWGY